ncbi:TOMM precursor leader peptide-binding protein [Haloarchaeobius sp. DYHT-AS-18]|uniref:TOMM precursor leader peptide-binding protein n=1 Tax=Haloarchaeobius sp. DYHT-AS-18 TaxID=3446117 RepID=UPI003EBEC2A6
MTDTSTPLASYPRINPAFGTVIESDDAVTFTAGPWSGPVFEIEDEDREGQLANFVTALDGTTHVDAILDSFDPESREDLRGVLFALQEKSIVRDAGEPVDAERARVGGYLALRDDESDREAQLANATLAVVGAGLAGRTFVRALLDSGVGGIEYVDLSTDTNTERAQADAGPREGVFADDRVTHHVDPDLQALLGESTFGAMAVDRPYPSVATALNEAAHRTGTPWTIGVVNGVDGQVGPTVYPGETACYDCFRERANAATGAAYTSFESSSEAPRPGLPAFATIVSGLLAADVIEQVTGGFGVTTGSVVDFDFDSFAVQADEVLRLPHCEACGRDADRLDAPRHVTIDRLASRSTEGKR